MIQFLILILLLGCSEHIDVCETEHELSLDQGDRKQRGGAEDEANVNEENNIELLKTKIKQLAVSLKSSEFSVEDQFYEELDSIKSAQSGDYEDLRSRIKTLETKVNEIKDKYNYHLHDMESAITFTQGPNNKINY